MPRARIANGIWTRKVPWEHNGEWRTDTFKSTLSDPRLRFARFVLQGGPTVVIAAEELRRVLAGGRDHYGFEIWGPFNINPRAGTVDGKRIQMQVSTNPQLRTTTGAL